MPQRHVSTMHSIRTLTVSFDRQKPASSMVKPTCMPNTRNAAISVQTVLSGLTTPLPVTTGPPATAPSPSSPGFAPSAASGSSPTAGSVPVTSRVPNRRHSGSFRRTRKRAAFWIRDILVIGELLFLGADKGHHTEQDRGLALGGAGVLLEVRLVGQVVAELKPAHQPATHLVFAGKGRFLYPLRRAGGEAVRIVKPFQASGKRKLLGQGIARRASDTGPLRRTLTDVLVAPVVEVDVVTELVVGVDQDRSVVQLAKAGIGVRLFGSDVIVVGPGHPLPGVGAVDAYGLAAVVVVNVIPALHDLHAAREVRADGDGGAHAEVVIRDGPRKQQRARVVPVLIGLDHLGAGGGDEFSGIDLHAVPGFRLEADVGLLEVLEGFRRAVGGVDRVECLAESHIQVKAYRGGSAVHGDHPHVDVRGVGAEIEVPELVESGIGMVEAPVHVAIEHEAEIYASLRERGLWRRRSGRLRGGYLGGGCLGRRLLCIRRWRLCGCDADQHAGSGEQY